MKKIIEKNGKHYEVDYDKSWWVEKTVCIETGEIFTREQHDKIFGYDNKLVGNNRYSCLASETNNFKRLDIAKSELWEK